MFIDEISLNGLFDPETQRYQIGFTLGGSITDLPIENLTAKIEYTKIYPSVYRTLYTNHDYKSTDYVLGHWMGHNADLDLCFT
ncbi:MAG: hypothetical protein MZV64_51750 [Ignavibacteriales bacterium]|nr:hypothetical protein [Ignavibacteriales bacterium]